MRVPRFTLRERARPLSSVPPSLILTIHPPHEPVIECGRLTLKPKSEVRVLGIASLRGSRSRTSEWKGERHNGTVPTLGALRKFENHPRRIEGGPDACRERNPSTHSTLRDCRCAGRNTQLPADLRGAGRIRGFRRRHKDVRRTRP